MPADVRAQVLAQALAHQLVGLGFPVEAVERQPFHRQRFAMIWEFLEDLVGSFHALFVLLGLVAFHDVAKELLLFLGKVARALDGRSRGRRHGKWW